MNIDFVRQAYFFLRLKKTALQNHHILDDLDTPKFTTMHKWQLCPFLLRSSHSHYVGSAEGKELRITPIRWPLVA
jgi:hypothetical protein